MSERKQHRDACTPQPREIFFDRMRYRSQMVQRLGDFNSKQCQLYKDLNNVSTES